MQFFHPAGCFRQRCQTSSWILRVLATSKRGKGEGKGNRGEETRGKRKRKKGRRYGMKEKGGRGRRGGRAEEGGRKSMGGPSSGFAPRKNFLAMPLYEVGSLHPAMGTGERYELPQMSSPSPPEGELIALPRPHSYIPGRLVRFHTEKRPQSYTERP